LTDPVFERTGQHLKGRDGCRVPLPWTPEGSSFGFGDDGSWLPQPAGVASCAVSVQQGRPESSLELYRRAIALRRHLSAAASFGWVDSGDDQVLRFARGGGWECIVNFSASPVPLPGEVLLTSAPRPGTMLAPETAAWIRST
jgi:alpha-glucosidase